MFSSLFGVVIAYRRKTERFTFQKLADATRRNKSEVSRWFASRPNWRIDTIADIAAALDLELEIRARERTTGRVFAPFGEVREIKAELIYPHKQSHNVEFSNLQIFPTPKSKAIVGALSMMPIGSNS
jgi:hypothetical protein